MDKIKFWISDYKELYKNLDFFPNKNMSRNELLNSFTRYSIISVIILFFIGSSSNWYYLPLGILFGSVILYLLDVDKQEIDEDAVIKKNHKCRDPDINNPYMNILATQDEVNNPACSFADNKVKEKANKFYKFNLYQNSNDIFEKKNLKRQFYTMPVSTIPSKQKDYVNWLYNTDGNCKANDKNCLEYEDERYH